MAFGMKTLTALTLALLASFAGVAQAQDQSLVLYSGRSKSLVEPLVERFQKETGIKVQVRYAGTTQLALTIIQEGSRSPADVFWAQDTGALELLHEKGLFAALPASITDKQLPEFRSPDNSWVATSARGRTLAFSSVRLKKDQLPASVFDLTDPKWKGKIGWSPANASFQAFVTGMRAEVGEEKTREWLKGIIANEPKAYPRNGPILDGIASGEIDLGLINHYYLLKTKSQKADFPVDQATFASKGDIGNLLFVAGAGVLKSSKNQDTAQKFVDYLLSESSQRFFTTEVYEYPVLTGFEAGSSTMDVTHAREAAPKVPYSNLKDLDGTLKLLKELGLN